MTNSTPNRRHALRAAIATGVGAAATGVTGIGWRDAITLQASELRRRGMSCILLFMRGGLSQLESFDPKAHQNGGGTNSISTATSGVHIAEHWPKTASVLNDVALVRSVVASEGEHDRAVYNMHTGYLPIATTKHPCFGSSVVASVDIDEALPAFVGLDVPKRTPGFNSGFLAANYAPLATFGGRLPRNLKANSRVDQHRLERRLQLMKRLEQDYARDGREKLVQRHQQQYRQAANMMQSSLEKAFKYDDEPMKLRTAYGETRFGKNCLLARRLVEQGVTFVEVELNGWDTHQDHFQRIRPLSDQADQGFATLVADLKSRSMLDQTLVILLSEFGRTPKVNARAGRDHHTKGFSVALAGGGIQGGQVVGKTSVDGMSVADRPVSINDLFCTFCRSLGVDHTTERLSSLDRPIKIVDGGEYVSELFSA